MNHIKIQCGFKELNESNINKNMEYKVLKSFMSLEEGVEFMNNHNYPSEFIVNMDFDKVYNKEGILTGSEKISMILNEDFININPLVENHTNGEYCYNGEYIFITK